MSFPEQPIRIILPFGPSDFSSGVGFALQPHLAAKLGVEIYFEHITGGQGGANGPRAAVQAAPDGYSLLIGTIGNIALLPHILPEYGVNPMRDLRPVSQLAATPNILAVNPDLGAVTLDDVVAAAKANPGALRFHGINSHSIHMLEFKSLIAATGMVLNKVPPKGGSAGAIEAILDGEIDLTISTGPGLREAIQAGDVLPIATIYPERSTAYADLPTLAELGIDTIGNGSWMGLFAPQSLPDDSVQALYDAVLYAATQPDVRETIAAQAALVTTNPSPAAALTFVENETERLRQACVAANFF